MKVLFAVALGMLLASSVLAQPPQKPNELYLGIGDASMIFWADEPMTVIMSLGNVTYGDREGGYQFVAGYQRWINRWASLGVTGSWGWSKKTAYFRGDPMFDLDRQLLVFMADGRGHWFRRPGVDLYSGLAIGLGEISDDLSSGYEDDWTGLAIHVIPIGARFGRDWGGFLETGLGIDGFIKAGLSRRF